MTNAHRVEMSQHVRSSTVSAQLAVHIAPELVLQPICSRSVACTCFQALDNEILLLKAKRCTTSSMSTCSMHRALT